MGTPPFFLDFCLNFCRDADLQEQDHFPRLAACRRRFFFGPNSVSLGKGPFSSAGGLPQALFFWPKMTILVFFVIFVGRRVPFFGHSLLSYSKRRHLSTSRVIPLIDCHQSLYFQHRTLSTFLPDLCFIWQSHRFQFLGCALPIGLSPSLIPATWGPKRATAERF